MARMIRSSLTWAIIGLGLASLTARGQQVIERDSTVVGPNGRKIERDIKVTRGPGYVDRQVEIKRPGETIFRDTRYSTPVGRQYLGGPPPFVGTGPRFYGGRPIVENFIVQRPPIFSTFVGVPGFSLFLGGVSPAPLPAPPIVVGYPPTVPAPAPAPAPPTDPLSEPLGQLKSLHSNHRRDGALACGNLRDPRAVPPLIHALEHDIEKEVRTAAAWALGEIGDPRATLPLEKAMIHDKRNDVRQAAKAALPLLRKPGQVVTEGPILAPTQLHPAQNPGQPSGTVRSTPNQVLDPGPNPRVIEDSPPPPPVPSTPPPIPPGLEPPRDLL